MCVELRQSGATARRASSRPATIDPAMLVDDGTLDGVRQAS